MDIRLFDKDDFEQSIELRKYIFSSPYTPQKALDYKFLLKIADNVGAFDNERNLLGQLLNLPIFYNFYGRRIPAVGINHVGVYPEFRGNGIASDLLKFSLSQAYKQGQILAILQPFSISFYRSFGFDIFTERRHYSITKEKMPKFTHNPEYKIVRVCNKNVTDEIMRLVRIEYDKVSTEISGCQIRDSNWWDRIEFQFPGLTYGLLFKEEHCCGYVSYTIDGTTLNIVDFISENIECENELWSFITAHQSNVFEINGMTTSAKPLGYQFFDPRINQELWLNTMIRIVDVKAFLNLWFSEFPAEKPFTINVNDILAPWNTGEYIIDEDKVNKTESAELNECSTVDAKELAMIFLGPLSDREINEQLSDRPSLATLIQAASSKQIAHFLGEF